jgi:polyhydroxyalkanoate synthesis regulator phasin
LFVEDSIVAAFHSLQKLHDEWREIGPVAAEYKEELWNRFKEASSRINKLHQQYFEEIKQKQQGNLDLKTKLCEQVEELNNTDCESRKEWNKASDKLLEIQKVWKTIGFAPKKENAKIYERFRAACDTFFERKRNYYSGLKDQMEENLALKIRICEQAEAVMMSEEWKSTGDRLIDLQRQWKEIGAVPRRQSDVVWKRFRAACDTFFERKAAHFSSVDSEHKDNLTRKRALLEEMEAFDLSGISFEAIKEFQRRWSEIGFVPIKQKETIQKQYKEAVDKLFGALRGSERERNMDKFRNHISNLKQSGDKRLRYERERLYGKVKQLEADIATLENNIGFFAGSKNAESLIGEVRIKIAKAKAEMAETIKKVQAIDAAEQE